MLKKLVVAFAFVGLAGVGARRGRIAAAADCRRARRVDDKDLSVYRQRYIFPARSEHQPSGGLAELFREKFDAGIRFLGRGDAR